MGGKKFMAVAPKDGFLYGFNRADNKLLFKTPVTKPSAFGTKRTSKSTQPMSAFGVKRTFAAEGSMSVFGGKADMRRTSLNVRS